jgi:hypothetical protein
LDELIESLSSHGNPEAVNQRIRHPKLIKRDPGVFGKLKKSRQRMGVNHTSKEILPKTNGVALTRNTAGNTPKHRVKPKNVFPPEGAFFPR